MNQVVERIKMEKQKEVALKDDLAKQYEELLEIYDSARNDVLASN